jgi:hypothetical protein
MTFEAMKEQNYFLDTIQVYHKIKFCQGLKLNNVKITKFIYLPLTKQKINGILIVKIKEDK